MLMIGPQWDSDIHHHAVIRLIISPENTFSVRSQKGDWKQTRSILINSNVMYQTKDLQGPVISLTTVPERRRGIYLRQQLLQNSDFRIFDTDRFDYYIDEFNKCLKSNFNCPAAFGICEKLIDDVTGINSSFSKIDERILSIITNIQNNLSGPFSAVNLANYIHLSEDRFLHIFKEQIGLPLRQYILHQRILCATREFLSGKNLTEAAFEAGFSDSAHFTRTFIEMHGFKPSLMARDKNKYRILYCGLIS